MSDGSWPCVLSFWGCGATSELHAGACSWAPCPLARCNRVRHLPHREVGACLTIPPALWPSSWRRGKAPAISLVRVPSATSLDVMTVLILDPLLFGSWALREADTREAPIEKVVWHQPPHHSHSLSGGLSPNPLVGKYSEIFANVEKDAQPSLLFPEGSFSSLEAGKHTSPPFSGSGLSLWFCR